MAAWRNWRGENGVSMVSQRHGGCGWRHQWRGGEMAGVGVSAYQRNEMKKRHRKWRKAKDNRAAWRAAPSWHQAHGKHHQAASKNNNENIENEKHIKYHQQLMKRYRKSKAARVMWRRAA
jgi:hypothetical protein